MPVAGHNPVRTGIYFDVVAIPGARGQELADTLIRLFDCHPGAIYQRGTSPDERVYFITAPKTTSQFRWPPSVLHYGDGETQSVKVPALDCSPTSWSWLSYPTHRREFVDCARLHELVRQLRNWEALPDPLLPARTPAPNGQRPSGGRRTEASPD
ncbi:hypothetical protein [Streptomyces sp. NBC_01565]|uniref:hypothetical protein n=1 Tax=Streptomyces sp. NBC_01565 TaxID=2975881 RepID=UPI00225A5AF3|nr:hypothetical protein [Streptomyces sp. NBC_01565]MCX4546877.1 hypothetical protein [Streptomyces sp. NBC_01565]